MIELGLWLIMPVLFWRLADETGAVGMFGTWQWMNSLSRGAVIVLAVMMVRTLSLAGDCLVRFGRARRQSRLFVRLFNLKAQPDPEHLLAAAERHPQSHIAKIVVSGLTGVFQFLQWSSRDLAIESSERSMLRTASRIQADLQYGLPTLATIASSAPFIGLLGTVGGLLDALGPVGAQADAARAWVAEGVSEALLTTAAGLLVAVPAAWAYNFFRDWLSILRIEMDNASSELVGYFLSRREWRREAAIVPPVEGDSTVPSFAANQNGIQNWEVAADSHILFLLPLWFYWLYCLYILARHVYFLL